MLELDMYQDIAVARGPTYDTLNARMDTCQQNIETMSNDIQRLQARVATKILRGLCKGSILEGEGCLIVDP